MINFIFMRNFILSMFMFMLVVAVTAPQPVRSEILDSDVPGMIFEHNVPVTMTDGIALRVNIYRPDKPGKFPVLMLMGPYNKDVHYKDAPAYRESWARLLRKYPDLCKQSTCRYMRWEAPDPERFVPDDYIVIHADSRGSGSSPGNFQLFSTRETTDFVTLIEWAADQSWSTGKVGLTGLSYYGINQWRVASYQPKGLAAIMPWEGAFDEYRELAHVGGIQQPWNLWYKYQIIPVQNGNANTPLRDAITGEKPTGDPLSPELLAYNRQAPDALFKAHPLDDAFYRERTPDASRIVVPVLNVALWGSWSVEGYPLVASKQKWMKVKTGDHLTGFYSDQTIAMQKRFFDHFLKGIDNGWEKEPPVTIEARRLGGGVPGGGPDRAEISWPLAGTQWDRYYLDASHGSMGRTNGAAAESSYTSNSEGLTFMTTPFKDEVEFTGPISLKTWVRSGTTDMDIYGVVRLIDPQGRDVSFTGAAGPEPHVAVTTGALRVSHRALDPERSTENQPFQSHRAVEPMTPGQLYEVDVIFSPTSVVVPKGYRLAVTLRDRQWHYTVGSKIVKANDFYLPRGPEDSGRLWPLAKPVADNGSSITYAVATGKGHSSYLRLPRIPTKR
ncbi:MAG: CocE/NonD family hydrolase [Emcibacter sp.]|nr:CocE/NonD family hydrolase [Emcibacter sp.]